MMQDEAFQVDKINQQPCHHQQVARMREPKNELKLEFLRFRWFMEPWTIDYLAKVWANFLVDLNIKIKSKVDIPVPQMQEEVMQGS